MSKTSERIFIEADGWAVGADPLQWILYRRGAKGHLKGVSFVSSERSILERCMQEKDCLEATRATLLAGLPETFRQWKEALEADPGAI